MRHVLLLSLLILSSLSHATTYKVAAYAWEPFVDLKRDDGGISIDLLRKALQTQGYAIELVPMPWARSLVMLEKGKVDILPAVWFTEERNKTMLYSERYAANRLVFIKAKDDDYEFEGLPSLYDKVVGVVRDYAYEESLLKDNNIRFSVADSLNSNIKKLIAGRVDLTIEDEIVAKQTIEPSLLKEIDFSDNALIENPLFITCSKQSVHCNTIIDAFNQGIASMQADGSYQRYFSERVANQ
ncbi:MAG: transporter substrate-binding domain-containing protein [Pseudomonadota bacterium]